MSTELNAQFSRFSSEHLLQKRGLGEDLSEEAHAAIEAVLTERGDVFPPKPSAPLLIPDEGLAAKRGIGWGDALGAVVFFVVIAIAGQAVKQGGLALAVAAVGCLAWLAWRLFYVATRSEEEQLRAKNKKTQTEEQMSELMIAASAGDLAKVRDQLDYGANVNATTVSGNTALMYASRNNHREIVELLLDRKADRTIKTKQGSTASAIAQRFGHSELAGILDPNIDSEINSSGKTA